MELTNKLTVSFPSDVHKGVINKLSHLFDYGENGWVVSSHALYAAQSVTFERVNMPRGLTHTIGMTLYRGVFDDPSKVTLLIYLADDLLLSKSYHWSSSHIAAKFTRMPPDDPLTLPLMKFPPLGVLYHNPNGHSAFAVNSLGEAFTNKLLAI
jgi:hypothetical protein